MKNYFVIFCVLISAFASEASEPNSSIHKKSEGPSAQEIEELFIFQCGSLEEMTNILKLKTNDLSDAEKAEVINSRKINLSIIREGAPAVKLLLKQGSKQDTGGFGAILACGLVSQISEKVRERGCVDLETNEVIKDGPGIEICNEMIKKVK